MFPPDNISRLLPRLCIAFPAALLFSFSFAQHDSLSLQQLTPYSGDLLKKNVAVVILNISENDLYYNKREEYIGHSGTVGSSRLIRNRGNWYKGSVKLDNGKRRFFEEVMISVEAPRLSPDVSGDSIAAGTRVKILGVSEKDLYYQLGKPAAADRHC